MAAGFDVDKVRDLMRTKPGEAVFWSGTTGFAKPDGMSEEEYRSMIADAGGEDRAKDFARAHDGKTLEMLMEEHKDELIDAGFPYDEETGRFVYSDGSPNPDGTPSKWGDTRECWDQISDAFAQGASGQVRVVFGMDENDLREGADGSIHSYESTWQRAELARIKQNPNITGVSAFDPYTEEEVETFTPDEIVLDADYEPRDYPPAADTTPDSVPVSEEPAVVDGHADSSFSTCAAVGLGAAAGAASSMAQSAAHTESSQSASSQSATLGDRYQSSYADRIRQTPSLESNRWAGERGESVCAPQSDAARQIMEERGISGVQYQDGVPDFSPFSESTVKLGYMTDARHSRGLTTGRDGKDTIYAHFEDGEAVSESHHADKSSMADLHMKYDKPGNFEQADALTAEQWTADGRDGKEWTAEDVAQYRQEHGLTWHECNDMETMQMIPEAINADFGHLGGVGEVKETQRIVEDALRDYDEGQMVESEDYDRMTPEELEAAAREHGHYDDDGVWIPDELTDAASIDLPPDDHPPVDGSPDDGVDNPPDEGADGGDDLPPDGQPVDGSSDDGRDNSPDEGPDDRDDLPPDGQPVDEMSDEGGDNPPDEEPDSGDELPPDSQPVDGTPDDGVDNLPDEGPDGGDDLPPDGQPVDGSLDDGGDNLPDEGPDGRDDLPPDGQPVDGSLDDGVDNLPDEGPDGRDDLPPDGQPVDGSPDDGGDNPPDEGPDSGDDLPPEGQPPTDDSPDDDGDNPPDVSPDEISEDETPDSSDSESIVDTQESTEQDMQEADEQEAEEQAAEEAAEQEAEEQAAEEAAEQEAEE